MFAQVWGFESRCNIRRRFDLQMMASHGTGTNVTTVTIIIIIIIIATIVIAVNTITHMRMCNLCILWLVHEMHA
jgi:uncharacterized Rmd1/YagE family protein